MKIKEFLLNILLEKKQKWKMKLKENTNFINKRLLLKIILFNKLKTKKIDNKKKLEEIKYKQKFGRKKPQNMFKLKMKKLLISVN